MKSNTLKLSVVASSAIVLSTSLAASSAATVNEMKPSVVEKRTNSTYSPYAGEDYPTQVFFGDTHHHTSNSGDAFMNGNRLPPAEAYKFARGEEVISPTGQPVKLSRPLDFLVVSDHVEGLGVMMEVYNGNPAFMKDETLARWSKAMKEGGVAAASATNELIVA